MIICPQETAQLRSQIDETEDELRAAKNAAGIISIPDAEKSYTEQLAWVRNQLFQAQEDLAAQQGQTKAQSQPQTNAAAPVVAANLPQGRQEEYQRVCARLEFLQNREKQYYTQFGYTDENRLVFPGNTIGDCPDANAETKPGGELP